MALLSLAMIQHQSFRVGNAVLLKIHTRIVMVKLEADHFNWPADKLKELFPVVLNPDIFIKAGFVENKKYPLYPDAREFKLVLPVQTENLTEIYGYIKNNKEAFARASVNAFITSNPVYHLHQVQNLYYALTGAELEIKP